jgi:peptidyl-prolyl cis-trans isomerase D
MLEFLRQKASGWFAKILLGLIALIFAIYFGFSGGGVPQGGTAPIAKVNGENIPSGLFNQMVDNQVQAYQRLGNAAGGAEFQQMLQTQILQRLISGALLAQEAHRLGLHISDAELAAAIRSDASFQKDGRFDEEFYLTQFKPFYERQNGINFEYGLREDLLQDRLKQVLQQTNVVSRAALEDELKLKDTELKIVKVTVPFVTQGEGRSKEEAAQIAGQWIQARQEKKSGDEIVKQHQLESGEMEPKSVQTLISFFGGTMGLPILSCLLGLEPGQVCPEAHPVGNKLVAVELVERSQKAPDPEAAPAMERQLQVAKQNLILTGVSNVLTRQAKIETFLNE